MGLEGLVGGIGLGSREIRHMIRDGRLQVSSFDEGKIQPSSFEPTLGDSVYVLDFETRGLFRPVESKSVYRSLLEIPARQRKRHDISSGFELKVGFTYLIPLQEKISLSASKHVKSSPKSSFGRVFLKTRLLSDYNPCFDEINGQYRPDTNLDLWLLVQPLALNVIAYPGLSLNQMRFFYGDALLRPAEVRAEFARNPLLYQKKCGALVPAKPVITDALQIHLDLQGEDTHGIVGLRARHNPEPVDLRSKGLYNAEEFFEPIKGRDGSLTIQKGEHYLFASKEVLKIPSHLNVELKEHSHIGISGPLHFAGFVDNSFEGDLVFEIQSEELSAMMLSDGMPVSKLDVFRTTDPDKQYGASIGSNYHGQVGPKPAKFFMPFDYMMAAKEHGKLNRDVLVQDALLLQDLRRTKGSSFQLLRASGLASIDYLARGGFFHSRYDCETDETVLQMIPYFVVFGRDDKVFSYLRAANIKKFGETRLFNKRSIGIGGHIQRGDGPDYIAQGLERELREEVIVKGKLSTPRLAGILIDRTKPVDRVHAGLVFVAYTNGSVRPRENSLKSGGMITIRSLEERKRYYRQCETWTKRLVPHLRDLYELAKAA
ncbi:2'-deoxycytidine 5'-triphosphate deaminase [Candidatus Woesearchaeota archaeon]|nr:2'-deoxycytidine 5'-triphosphate deaminase [Candidatus Woesearchaeota archaeon]